MTKIVNFYFQGVFKVFYIVCFYFGTQIAIKNFEIKLKEVVYDGTRNHRTK